jgi:hypothetical protein
MTAPTCRLRQVDLLTTSRAISIKYSSQLGRDMYLIVVESIPIKGEFPAELLCLLGHTLLHGRV